MQNVKTRDELHQYKLAKVEMHLGLGLVATVPFVAGQLIYCFRDSHTILHERDYLSVQVSEDKDVLDPHVLSFLNHSCDPNTRVDTVRFEVVAIRDIEPGEILTFFYPETEWEMARPFTCHCRSPRCLGLVRGARHMSRAAWADYNPNPHILRLLERQAR